MANPISGIDDAGRKIAGLLTYNPGPGIYSRLERAIEQMPENVRVQELPGLLKRYKEGVPGWELKETDLDSVIAGRDAVSRSELLARVKERSPVYTHGEIILGGNPPQRAEWFSMGSDLRPLPGRTEAELAASGYVNRPKKFYQQSGVSPLAEGISHGEPKYKNYGQGGDNYTELLITQPGANGPGFGSHWSDAGRFGDEAVAHARFDTHGDALRINELQSDLGIHNRKRREYAAQNPQTTIVDGQHVVQNDPASQGSPFPLEDTWADLLIKRLALEAARKGHRAIEVASPRAIADKVGGNIDNYEHFYGKVVPGALERLGRKMGGLELDATPSLEPVPGGYEPARAAARKRAEALAENAGIEATGLVGGSKAGTGHLESQIESIADAISGRGNTMNAANHVFNEMVEQAVENGWPRDAAAALVSKTMPRIMRMAEDMASVERSRAALGQLSRSHFPNPVSQPPAKRYLMSDEMRRRLIEQGVGASVLAPLLMQEER